ncbi:formate dehydrogenase (NAD+) [Saitozyma podzolica]|uniref:Formate dehydrogenase (NAD+) n=1 Tax=Saitozyma podzolica TaxID=1890683 RepID=A0A427YT13_9TREE|nr:formate dehydrogenase (NAD+) [Saitozyma podzolica]
MPPSRTKPVDSYLHASAASTVLATPVGSTIIASVDTATEPPTESKLKSEPDAEAKSKRRKVQAKTSAARQTAPPTPEGLTRILVPLGDSAPSLLPATLSFPFPHAVSHLSTVDPRFAGMFTHLPCRPFHPPLEAIDPFRTLVTSIIGQQVSWMAARAINNRFRALFGYGDGERYGAEDGFPTPMMVSKAEVAELKGVGLSTRKAEYVISLSEHFVSGELSTELLRDGTDEEIAKALIAVRGIGQSGDGELDTRIRTPSPEPKTQGVPPTPITPAPGHKVKTGVLHTPNIASTTSGLPPPTPQSPTKADEVLEVPAKELPPPAPEELLTAPTGHEHWDSHRAAPLLEGLSLEVLRARLAGKKVKSWAKLYKGGRAAEEETRLLGTVENKLGMANWLRTRATSGFGLAVGFIVTEDKAGPNSVFQKNIADTDVLITTPFHPAYLTAELFAKAKNLKLCITAGVGSDHIDLNAANEHKVTVAEVTGSNVTSVAEHHAPPRAQLCAGARADREGRLERCVARSSFDLEGKVIGTVGAGRIGQRVLKRLMPFDPKELLYLTTTSLPLVQAAEALGVRRVADLGDMVSNATSSPLYNCPLHEKTKGLFNKELISRMRHGAWLVNTARGAICVAEDVAEALASGQLNGYAGDVWTSSEGPPMAHDEESSGRRKWHGPAHERYTLDAQYRYATGAQDILRRWFAGEKQESHNLIVENGEYATKAYGDRKR